MVKAGATRPPPPLSHIVAIQLGPVRSDVLHEMTVQLGQVQRVYRLACKTYNHICEVLNRELRAMSQDLVSTNCVDMMMLEATEKSSMFYRQNNLQLLREGMEQFLLLRDETGIVGYGNHEDETTVVARITMRFPPEDSSFHSRCKGCFSSSNRCSHIETQLHCRSFWRVNATSESSSRGTLASCPE